MKNTAFLYIRMVLVMVTNLYTSRLVLQALGVEDYGLYSVVGGIVLLFSVINSALGAGTSRFITFELGRGDLQRMISTFSASFHIHLFIALIVLLVAETAGLWYVNNLLVVPPDRLAAANWIYQFSILSCMFSLTQVPYGAAIVAHEKMNVYAWVGISEAVVKLLLTIVLVYTFGYDKLIAYGFFIMLWSVALQVYYRYYCKKNFRECSIRLRVGKDYYKNMISFSMWDVVGNFTVQGHSQGISMMMNAFFGLTVNAAKGVASQVSGAITQFSGNFITAVRPQIVKAFADGNITRMHNLVTESSRISFFLLYMVVLPFCMESEYVLSLWLKEVPDHTRVFTILVLMSGLMRAFANPVVQAVHATGNIKNLNIYSGGTSVCLNLPIIYLAYKIGAPAEASYIVGIASCLVCNYIELWCLRKETGFGIMGYTFNVYIRSILIGMVVFVPTYLVHSIFETSFMRLILVCITSTAVLAVLVYLFGIDSRTRDEIKDFIQRKLSK